MNQFDAKKAEPARRSTGAFTLAELLVVFTACCAVLGIGSQMQPYGGAAPQAFVAVGLAAVTGAVVGGSMAVARRWFAGGILLAGMAGLISGTMGGLAVMVELRLSIVMVAGLILCALALICRRLQVRVSGTPAEEPTVRQGP